MSEPTDTTARVAARVARRSKGVYEAYAAGASGTSVCGIGATAKEATAALAAALAWTGHCDPSIALDGEGHPWLIYPWGPSGSWTARRVSGLAEGIHAVSRGSTIFEAPSWSKARETIALWNAPLAP